MTITSSLVVGPLGIGYRPDEPPTFALVDERTFGVVFTLARGSSPQVAAATSPFDFDEPVTKERDYFVSLDGRSGYAVEYDGTLVFVFSLERGRGDVIVRHAVRHGATRLDCFDGYLPGLYARHGFVETGREPNWTPGEPDVVFMSLPDTDHR